ncbi:hypothetical protein MKX01_023711 [Papaver californicum]|nr:hypothetical protein MKX01_023711 [Papaver californicum]
MAKTSKILIIGGTGYIGKFIAEASLKSGNPTFLLVRDTIASDPVKGKLIESFKNSGATLLYGDLYDHGSLVTAIKQVDVVISTVGYGQIVDQVKIVAAITEAGNIKIMDSLHIPHFQLFRWLFLPNFSQPGATTPPRDKVIILGDGNPKANTLSFNDLVSLWEKKIGKTLEKEYVPDDQVLKNIQEAPIPLQYILSITHSVFVKGDQTFFEIEPSFGVEASELYPDVKYTTVDEYLDQFV